MSKKDYQALARAIYEARMSHGLRAAHEGIDTVRRNITDALAASNPRFNRALFLEACETGKCKGMRK